MPARNNLIWTIVGLLLILVLIVWLIPHVHIH